MDSAQVAQAVRSKTVTVTGGTGSFGHQIIRELMQYQPRLVNVVSRDEKKQYDMKLQYGDLAALRFRLADVRDAARMREVLRGTDLLFHAAALKQVPNCEFDPFEAVQTNVIGAENVRRAAIEAGVECVVAISTDKAVKPVNVMGMSKALQERLLLHPTDRNADTRFVGVRYGNVLGSRGSVIPLFKQYIDGGRPLPVTHPDMTRFQLTLRDAVQLVLWATATGESGDLWVRKMPASTIMDLGKALAYGMTGRRDYPIEIIGARPGEKMHEILVSEEEMWRATELDDYFRIPTWGGREGEPGPQSGSFSEYSSREVHQLTEDELLRLLSADGWFSNDGRNRVTSAT